MTCQEFIELLLTYVDDDADQIGANGDLDVVTRQLCDRHRRACVECADYLVSYQTTLALVRGVGDDDFDPATLPPEVVEAILQTASGE